MRAEVRIVCGWCAHVTLRGECSYCHRQAEAPWMQRGVEPPVVNDGRPQLDEGQITTRYEAARRSLMQQGKEPTIDAIAEIVDRSPRTVRQWRERFGLR